ncbi:hypothetical protein EJD97_024452 [Solanum chilense]|uniref:Uncharacterized protein n=1 Tax=Solanum chilense TaxID=4083 RepID=A0A6N2ASR8_SOLCI|nr:hypothetical protein EJD97_024452 [Solanum chilense]
MPSHNISNVESHIILVSVSRLHRDKVGRLSHPVHSDPYGVVLSHSLQKTNHEVHINGIYLPCQNLDHLSKTLGHIFNTVLLHAIPPIDLLNVMIHLGGTWMYQIFGIMGLYHNFGPQIIHIWYT